MSNHLDQVMKHVVDSAVNAAMERLRDKDGEGREAVYIIAHAAAEIAVEQFRSYCKVEMSLIMADRESRLREAMLRPPSMMFAQKET